MSLRAPQFAVAALAAGILGVTGCSGSTGALAPSATQSLSQQSTVKSASSGWMPEDALGAIAPQAFIIPAASKTTATKTEKLNPKGGKLVFPGITGYAGFTGYPTNNASKSSTITITATSNNSVGAPPPPSGTALYELQVVLNGSNSVTFNSGTVDGQFVAKKYLDSNKTYTIYVFVPAFSQQPVETIAAGSPTHGTLTFSSPFDALGTLPPSIVVDLVVAQN